MTAALLFPLLSAVALSAAAGEGDVAPASPTDYEERVVGLSAWPQAPRLDEPFGSVQMLLFAELEDGTRLDVTRAAERVAVPGALHLDEGGRLWPREGRRAQESLRFRFGDHELELPVELDLPDEAAPRQFVRDVMPVLNKAGCTAGTCHGSADGQNGFQLSLRGYDPRADHRALTDDLAGRRFDPVVPERSLFLQKPTGAVPHEGGALLTPGSADHRVLVQWVASGAPFEAQPARVVSLEVFPQGPRLPRPGLEQQFAAWATYADGTRRDVTSHAFFEVSNIEVAAVDERGLLRGLRRGESGVMARYEGAYASTRLVVMEERGEPFAWPAEPEHNYVDELVHAKLRRVEVTPSELCSDAEFLRRVRLDLTGEIPTPEEVRTFLVDGRDTRTKRDELIDRLIGSPSFVEHWTNRWADLLQVNSKFLGDEGARRTREWIRAQVASNTPYDEFVRSVLTASGSTYENPAGAYFKVLREPDLLMENTTQLFLGVRFNCNKCHDHPFERWTRKQHWSLAAYFARVGRENAPGSPMMPRSVENQIDGTPPAFEELLKDMEAGELAHPDTGMDVPPAFPFELEEGPAAEAPRREQLARWLTARSNPYFARSYVNRLWSYLMGVGLIEPVDDLRAGNPPSNAELLDRLTHAFLQSDFDVRALLRDICRSRAYQRSIATTPENGHDDLNYAHALARRLPAEVLHDALHRATGSRPQLPGQRPGRGARQLVDTRTKTEDGFLDLFGRPARESSCECERSSDVSLGQALSMLNGPTVARAVRDPDNELARLARYEREPAALIDELYVAFLGRPPTGEEVEALAPSLDVEHVDNLEALAPEDLAAVRAERDAWAAAFSLPEWSVATPTYLHSRGGATLALQEDGAVTVTGEDPERDRLTLVLQVESGPVRGLRLEALADPTLPAGGPGRAENGNFVLHELRAQAVPLEAPWLARPLTLVHATADYSQSGWAVAGAVDGDLETGWAVSDRFGVDHEAVFEVQEDLQHEGADVEGRFVIFVELDQEYGSSHTLGRLRISTTSSERPIRHHGLPTLVADALRKSPDERSAAEWTQLHAEFVRRHPDVAERLRIAATQDLAWALAGSPAFLFNR